eukprot:2003077-Rhodomonas_salina.2
MIIGSWRGAVPVLPPIFVCWQLALRASGVYAVTTLGHDLTIARARRQPEPHASDRRAARPVVLGLRKPGLRDPN